jgi:Tol biopolymer transport system component
MAYPDRARGIAIVERLSDSEQWEIDSQESRVSFTPDSQHLVWIEYDEDVPWDSREETIWLANVDGSKARAVFSGRRTDPVAWLSDDELLMIRRFARTSEGQMFSLSLKDGSQTELMTVPRMRGLTLSADRRYLVYYVSFQAEAEQNGVWLIDLQNPALSPEKLPFFGTYRWRDPQRLIYIPLDPDATTHDFYEYNVRTRDTRSLFPAGTNLTVANNDWQVSPDGRQIVLVAAKGTALDGIWVLDID